MNNQTSNAGAIGTLGFLGLGLMGGPATAHLARSGFSVVGFDPDADKRSAAAANGVATVGSVQEVCATAEIVLMCVTSTARVNDIVNGPGGIMGAPGKVRVVVDHSTTVAGTTRELAASLRSTHDIGFVDAPVSGGPPAAANGTLAIMAGGDDADIARIAPVMDCLAASFTHMGPSGAGQVTKMVNQILVLNNYCVLAEALSLAQAGGVDASRIPAALAAGHAGSNLLQAMFPRMIERDFAPAGYARQVLKDLDMVGDLARELSTPTPMSSQAATLFRMLVARGDGELDGISVLKLFEKA